MFQAHRCVLVKDFGKPPAAIYREGPPFIAFVHNKHSKLWISIRRMLFICKILEKRAVILRKIILKIDVDRLIS